MFNLISNLKSRVITWFMKSIYDFGIRHRKYNDKKFGCYFSTRRYNASITFHVGTRVRIPAKFIAARAWSGCGRDIPVNTLGMLRETQKRRLPPFAIICSDAFTCLASGAKSKREVRVENGHACALASARREAVKQNECIRKAGDFSLSTKEELTVRTIEVQTRG